MKYVLAIILLLMPSVAWADIAKVCRGVPYPETDEYLICSQESGWIEPIMCNGEPCDFSAAKTAKKGDICTFACGKDTSWHLLTVSHSGMVSLIRGLSKGECEKAKKLSFTDRPDGMFDYEDSDIDRAECFQ